MAVILLVSSAACSGAGGQAFERYRECSDGMSTGDDAAVEMARSCYVADHLEVVLALPDPPYYLASTRLRDVTLFSAGPHAGDDSGVELRMTGTLDGVPASVQAQMLEIDGVWRIGRETLDVKTGGLGGTDGTQIPQFELREDGRVVLDARTGVWRVASTGPGVRTLVVQPYFDGPEIQIDGSPDATGSRTGVIEVVSGFVSADPGRAEVRYRTADGPAYVRGGELVVDEVVDGHMSGALTLHIEPGTVGEIRRVTVELTFTNLPVA